MSPPDFKVGLLFSECSLTAASEITQANATHLAITEVNSGVYAFDTAVLRDALGRLSDGNAQGELYLTDAIAVVDADGGRAGSLEITDAWLVTGVNDRVQLAAMRAELNRRLLQRWMLAGVTVVDPATTYVDALRTAIDQATDGFVPDLVFISAGFDSLKGDPLGGFTLELEHISLLTTHLVDQAKSWCGGRLVSALEGGYDPERLAQASVTHMRALAEIATLAP